MDRRCTGTRGLVPCRTFLFIIIFRLKILFSFTQRSSHLTLCLYEKRYLHPDVIIGTHETRIPVASQSGPSCLDFPFVQLTSRAYMFPMFSVMGMGMLDS